MCLFSVAFQAVPDCPLLVFANRDESPERPTSVPQVFESSGRAAWLGGQDLLAGGTWLGVNSTGLLVAVTNRRKTKMPPHPKSRGVLCRELLEQGDLEAAEAEFLRQWTANDFAGFNLMLLTAERGVIISAVDDLTKQSLQPGLHAVTNSVWNDPADKRIARVRGLMESLHREGRPWENWISRAKTICRLGEQSGGDAVCIPFTKGWGTVSSTVIGLPADSGLARYEHAADSPASTPYRDYSDLLVSLMERKPS